MSPSGTGSPVRGGIYAAAAFLLWGLFPIYWKHLEHIDPVEILCHRAIWSAAFLWVAFLALRRGSSVRASLRRPGVKLAMLLSALIIGSNWFVFVLAMMTDRVLHASLGYYINPLVNVVLGFLFLRERPRRLQWIAVGLAATGLTTMAIEVSLPWIALYLAVTFGLYGLLRKVTRVDAIGGLCIEATVLAPVALFWLSRLHAHGTAQPLGLLLLSTGIVTAAPLVLFGAAARHLTLTTLGFFQYIAPTCQFLLAVFAFGENWSASRLVAFLWIWAAVALYSLEGLQRANRERRASRRRLRSALVPSVSAEDLDSKS